MNTTTTTTKRKEPGDAEEGDEDARKKDVELDAKGRPKLPPPENPVDCPRCTSKDTKFCYYNNHNIKQPRYYCKGCQRYWTEGGVLRNVPVGSGRRKSSKTTCAAVTTITSMTPYQNGKTTVSTVQEGGPPKMFSELGSLGELAIIAHQAEQDMQKRDGSSDGSATEMEQYETKKKNTKKAKHFATTENENKNKNTQQHQHEEHTFKGFPKGIFGVGGGGAIANFYNAANLGAGVGAPMMYPFGYGSGNGMLFGRDGTFTLAQLMHQVAGASNNLDTLLSPTERAWAHSVGFNGMEWAVNAMSVAGLTPRISLNRNGLNHVTAAVGDGGVDGSGSGTALTAVKVDSDGGSGTRNADTDGGSDKKTAFSEKSVSQSDSGNTDNDGSRDGSGIGSGTPSMCKNNQNTTAAGLFPPLFVHQNMCPNIAMMDPSTFAQHQQLVQQQQQQMLIALSQMHRSQGIQMTHPQHPFQQGFEQQHRNHIEEQPAPIAGTAGATTTTATTNIESMNTPIEENEDGVKNVKRRSPRRDDTARELGGRIAPKKSVPP